MPKNQMVAAIAAGLFVVVVVLGYMLYEERQKRIRIDLPGIKIEAE